MARRSNPKPFKRTDRIGELVREIVASELERIGDDRLELVTVTDARVDRSLERAEVFYSAMLAEADDRLDEVEEALEEVRWPIQQVVNRQVRARRTPQIRFVADDVLSEAMRIDDLLSSLPRPSAGDTGTVEETDAPGDVDGSEAQNPPGEQ